MSGNEWDPRISTVTIVDPRRGRLDLDVHIPAGVADDEVVRMAYCDGAAAGIARLADYVWPDPPEKTSKSVQKSVSSARLDRKISRYWWRAFVWQWITTVVLHHRQPVQHHPIQHWYH